MAFRLNSRYKLHTTNQLLGLLGLGSEAELKYLLNNKEEYFRKKIIKNKRWDETLKADREGWVPKGKMRLVHDRIAGVLLKDLHAQLPTRMMGGRPGYSTKTMAKLHCNKEAVLKMDIESCFDSISPAMVKDMLWKSLNTNCSKENVAVLAELLTVHDKLPQGAPGSTAVCNCVLFPIFNSIDEYCQSHDLTVSSWIDDFVVSGPKSAVYTSIPKISHLFKKHRFNISKKKTKVLKRGEFGEVVGMTLGRKPSFQLPKREFLRKQWMNAANGDKSVPLSRLDGKTQFVKKLHPGFVKRLKKFQDQAKQKLSLTKK